MNYSLEWRLPVWCLDPDEAFDIGCHSIGVEDWCKDNSNCHLQRKDRKMYILAKRQINLKEIDESDIVIQIHQDGKTFSVLKHRLMETDKEYHMSHLKNILTAGEK